VGRIGYSRGPYLENSAKKTFEREGLSKVVKLRGGKKRETTTKLWAEILLQGAHGAGTIKINHPTKTGESNQERGKSADSDSPLAGRGDA